MMAAIATVATTARSLVHRPEGADALRRVMTNVDMACSLRYRRRLSSSTIHPCWLRHIRARPDGASGLSLFPTRRRGPKLTP